MTFEDLPRDWSTRPLTEPQLLDDVLDLMVGERSRTERPLTVLVCDEQVLLPQPMCVDELPERCDPELVTNLVDIVVAMSDVETGTLILALGRAGRLSITDVDRARVAAARDALSRTSWRLASTHVVTLQGSRTIPAAA